MFSLRAAIIASLLAFASASRAQVSPAVTRYEVISKGPIKGDKPGETTLGYSYRTRSIDDPKALSDEAIDLMTQLVSEATLGHYMRVIITAVGPAAGAKGIDQSFVIRPSGEWVDARSLGEHTPMLTALRGAYRKLDAGFQAENEEAILALTSKVFVHELATGAQRTMAQDLEVMKSELKSVTSWKTVMNGVFIRGDWAYVVATQDFTGEAYDGKHVLQKLQDTAKSIDTWVSNGQDAQLVRSRDLEEQMAPAH